MTLLWPDGTTTRPDVRSDFDPRRLHPVDKVIRPHNGIDLVGWRQIKSPVNGLVIKAGPNGSAGNTVDVREDGTGVVFRHFHLNSIAVAHGDRVAAGDPLGVMGATGKVTGVHLHFEVRINGVAQNPTTYYATRQNRNFLMALTDAEQDELLTATLQVRDYLGARGGLNTRTEDTVGYRVRDTQLALTSALPILLTSSQQNGNDAQAIAAAVVAAIPDDLAADVLDALARRLGTPQ